jgi:hypothetical protein
MNAVESQQQNVISQVENLPGTPVYKDVQTIPKQSRKSKKY